MATYDDLAICHNVGVYKNGYTNAQNNLLIDQSLLKNIDMEGIRIYPNPATTEITLDYYLEDGESATLSIYNSMGELQMKTPISNATVRSKVPIDMLNTGLYLYRFEINNKKNYIGKFIKE